MMIFMLYKKQKLLQDTYLITGTGLSSNIYLLGKQELTLIDVGNDSQPNVFITELHKAQLEIKNIKQIIITHTHFDHIGGLSQLLNYISPKIYVHETEQSLLSSLIKSKQSIAVRDGDLIATEVGSLQTLHTPGHSPGAICLYDQSKRILYSGDTVFSNGLFGRCDLRGGDAQAMVQSLHRLRALDTDILLPGHETPVFHQAKRHVELSFRNAQSYFSRNL
jgi:glyoxylase-like metal-dependent hydrolase (beta-lactamase superfamily II)